MSFWQNVLAVIAAILIPAIVGSLLRGFDRRISARMQGRVGPPLLQPVYDILKLLGKQSAPASGFQVMAVWGYLGFILAATIMFAWRQDLLYLILLLGVADIFLIVGAFSVKSPYSHAGANRELLQILAYEPILLLVAIAIYIKTGTFMISGIDGALLPALWPVFLAIIVALIIIMRKSPFDIAASEHGHQEIVKGVMTEYSGRELAIIEIAHTFELVLVLAVISLFWLGWGILLALAAWFAVVMVDNVTARLTWRDMLRLTWLIGLGLGAINIFALKALG
ncbi:MAG: NADH-quinone oxidoreductase subunit H [Dehalogenimonas sp.]